MLTIYKYPAKEEWDQLVARPASDLSSLEKSVRKILEKVKEKGDKAIRQYTKTFDGVTLRKLVVTEAEIKQADASLPASLKDAITQAKQNIETFHRSQIEVSKPIETMPGVTCWRKSLPIDSIGLYIPGGSAPLFSTVLMLAVPAVIAGCSEIVICTPPSPDGSVHPAVLYAARLCGVSTIIKAGGVQAIAAMAYGTESVPRVRKIFGPGNSYVTFAKQLVQQQGIAIDMPAGPSEVLVIADDTANPSFVAADLLSQAEHGTDSQVMLVTTSDTLAEKVSTAINEQLESLPRKEIAWQALRNSKTIIVHDLDEAVALSDHYAPEHLILSCTDAKDVAEKIKTAGSVFIGNYSPESAGDYASGTNHTLPTNGYAAMYSGISLDSFVKKVTFQKLSKEGLQAISTTVMEMAAAEGLEAHKNAILVRLK